MEKSSFLENGMTALTFFKKKVTNAVVNFKRPENVFNISTVTTVVRDYITSLLMYRQK